MTKPPAARKRSKAKTGPRTAGAKLRGGCHCGALRYRASALPSDSGYCHCSICRLTTGAPTAAWYSVAVKDFTYEKGKPKIYKSSAWGQREFCGRCGCQILFRPQKKAEWVTVNTPTLDKPAAVPPRRHIYNADRISWFDTKDSLPRLPKG